MSDYDEMGLAPGNIKTEDLEHKEQKCEPQVWQSKGQSYQVTGWRATSGEKVENDNSTTLACMIPMNKRRRSAAISGDIDIEDESFDMVCNMTGQTWESVPFPIIIDPGACASVMPTEWCNHVPIHETPQSKAGDYYRAVNGNKIHHEGERVVTMMTQEGSMRDMRFTVCDVSKAFGSVFQMCRTGHRVVFNFPWSEEGSYIEQEVTGERMWLQEEGGLYVLKTNVVPSHTQTSKIQSEDFTWQVIPP